MNTHTDATPGALSAQSVDRFRDLGFLVVPGVAEPGDLARVRALLDPLFDRFDALPKRVAVDLGGGGPRPTIPEVNGTARLEPRLLQTRVFRNCRRAAAQLLGGRATFWGDHAIYKPPQSAKATAWHQDRAYVGHGLAGDVVTFWVPLQDVTAEMGCMQFIPRSHRGGMLPHRPREGDAHSHVLMLPDVDQGAAVVCPIPAGSATVHAALTVHGAGPNVTDHYRRAWILAFSASRRYAVARAASLAVSLARRALAG